MPDGFRKGFTMVLLYISFSVPWACSETENSSGNVENLQRNDPFADLTANQHRVRLPLPSPYAFGQLPENGGEEFNRLVFESSPYLLQHARNPIDWFPWGEEAFALAKKEDKPVFL
ncbi:MAG: DUF255 domain-containing protein, partial [Verrucomicrobiota bacterium]|nr:DUF255 domain-containing protein [Verrucomicrobiota bacterium]